MIRALWGLIAMTFKIALIMIGLFMTYHLVAAGFYFVSHPHLLKKDLLDITQGENQTISILYGKPVANVDAFRIQYVPKDEIAPVLFWAVMAIEDERFKKHSGVDFYAIIRATYYNVMAKEYTQGGSTITQQLAKNLYLNPEKRFSRKLIEAFFAKRLESNFTKEEILEMYVNQMFYGQGQYGIERASQFFFKKSAKDLTVGEAAFLAALLQAPSLYSNPANFDITLLRQQTVIDRMVEQNYISQEQAKQAKDIAVKAAIYR